MSADSPFLVEPTACGLVPLASHGAPPLVLDGKVGSQALLAQLQGQVAAFVKAQGVQPSLAVVQVGQNPASSVYVKKKAEMAKALGMASTLVSLAETVSEAELTTRLQGLNDDPAVHGILLQLPLPSHLNALPFQQLIAPQKDVDGFHPLNLGLLLVGGQPFALPCTPAGVLWLLQAHGVPLAGKHVVVLGRSNIVGKPMAHLALQQHATVTVAHSKTNNLAALLAMADVVVLAVGVPHLVKASQLKAGAVLVDVGINRLEDGRLVGDAQLDEVAHLAAYTPVPGGVGPMTIALLMHNTLLLAQQAALQP